MLNLGVEGHPDDIDPAHRTGMGGVGDWGWEGGGGVRGVNNSWK